MEGHFVQATAPSLKAPSFFRHRPIWQNKAIAVDFCPFHWQWSPTHAR